MPRACGCCRTRVHRDHVVDEHEVAPLLAGRSRRLPEELDLPVAAKLVEAWNATEAMRPLCDSRGP